MRQCWKFKLIRVFIYAYSLICSGNMFTQMVVVDCVSSSLGCPVWLILIAPETFEVLDKHV